MAVNDFQKMKFKKFRFWLAGIIVGGEIVGEVDMEQKRQEGEGDQLEKGRIIVKEYEVSKRH